MKRRMRGTEASKQAALLRLGLTPLLSAPALFAALIFLGAGSPVGLLFAIPPFLLLWIWCVDAVSLLAKRPLVKARPRYYWLAAACIVPCAAFWIWNRLS